MRKITMVAYDKYKIRFDSFDLTVYGLYEELEQHVIFYITLEFLEHAEDARKESVIYNQLKRKKFKKFDPDMITVPDLRVVRIADKFKSMGEARARNRFKTLQMKS
jgi:hypothetical protein